MDHLGLRVYSSEAANARGCRWGPGNGVPSTQACQKRVIVVLPVLIYLVICELRMGGVVSERYDVHGEVLQGCVIAPLLFNSNWTYFVVQQAMPERCGVKLAYHAADGKPQRAC